MLIRVDGKTFIFLIILNLILQFQSLRNETRQDELFILSCTALFFVSLISHSKVKNVSRVTIE